MKETTKIKITCVVLAVVLPIFLAYVMSKLETEPRNAKTIEIMEPAQKKEPVIEIDVVDASGTHIKMNLDEYLLGVLLCEMPANFESEALKAQAVAARTYTLRRSNVEDKHKDATVCMDPSCCHGYTKTADYLKNGGTADSVDKVAKAVNATTGEVLLYQGELIEATYFSCSGGMTEDAVAVWGTDIPYLQATPSPGEEKATYYTDTIQYNKDVIAQRLGVSFQGNADGWFEITEYTDGGGVARINVCGVDFKGTEFRSLLNLRSTIFTITAVGNTVTITTKGYGHRVGMSQYGAEAMALQGNTYQEILAYYYQGTELSRISVNN